MAAQDNLNVLGAQWNLGLENVGNTNVDDDTTVIADNGNTDTNVEDNNVGNTNVEDNNVNAGNDQSDNNSHNDNDDFSDTNSHNDNDDFSDTDSNNDNSDYKDSINDSFQVNDSFQNNSVHDSANDFSVNAGIRQYDTGFNDLNAVNMGGPGAGAGALSGGGSLNVDNRTTINDQSVNQNITTSAGSGGAAIAVGGDADGGWGGPAFSGAAGGDTGNGGDAEGDGGTGVGVGLGGLGLGGGGDASGDGGSTQGAGDAGSLAGGGSAAGGDGGNGVAVGGDSSGGNVSQYFGQSSNVASGDHSVAAGDDVDIDNINTNINVGDINIGNEYFDNSFNTDLSDHMNIEDSFQDHSMNDYSDNLNIDDSFQDNSLEVDVDVDNANVGSPFGDANEFDF